MGMVYCKTQSGFCYFPENELQRILYFEKEKLAV